MTDESRDDASEALYEEAKAKAGGAPMAPLRRIHISTIPETSLAAMRACAADQEELNGGWSLAPEPVVFIRMRDDAAARRLARATPVNLVIWNWPTQFGRVVSFTILSRDGQGRVLVPFSEALLDHFEQHGSIRVVLGTHRTFLQAYEANFRASDPQGLWPRYLKSVDDRTMVVRDERAAFWATYLHQVGSTWSQSLTPADRVQLHWVDACSTQLHILAKLLPAFDPSYPQDKLDPPLRGMSVDPTLLDERMREHCPALHEIASLMTRSHEKPLQDVAAMLEAVRTKRATGYEALNPLVNLFGEMRDAAGNREAYHSISVEITRLLLLAILLSPECAAGRRRPWLDGQYVPSVLQTLELDLAYIGSHDPKYWLYVDPLQFINTGYIVTERDLPIPLAELAESALKLEPGVSENQAEELVGTLLKEAAACRKWSIPYGARVELEVADFVAFQFYEVGSDIMVKLYDAKGRFAFLSVDISSGEWNTPFMRQIARTDADLALRILVASVIRDFLVVEDREAAFGTRTEPSKHRRREAQEPLVIYLPRIRYQQTPAVERGLAGLALRERTPHMVAPHLRRSQEISEAQRKLARAYGFTVPAGYTFVRGHRRGLGRPDEEQRERIYRSRSALAAIYETVDAPITGVAQWFKFEKDVQKLMRRLGFRVEHISAHRRDDRGVDVFAISEDEAEAWAIQCKCWSPDRPVGPEVVRELMGALSNYPDGTKGMIVTTSRFTPAASAAARDTGVTLMDGDEFAGLVGTPPPSAN
ncbi:MAG TPA: restriction endonuclease [Nevskiaceae bacterium]|nr:restriction endonuclease [Nevskiaceae bacterium]